MSEMIPEQTSPPLKMDWKLPLLGWMEQSQQIVLQWLYAVGGWIFAGLIAVALMIVQNIMAIGSADHKLLVAGLALAAALPLNLAGLWIVRYIQNMAQAEAQASTKKKPAAGEASNGSVFSAKKRSFTNRIVTIVLALSVLLTLLGLTLALWHISWGVGIVFLIMVLIGLALTVWALAYQG